MLCRRHLRLLQASDSPSSKLLPLVPLVPRPRVKAHVASYPVASIMGHVTNPTNDYEALKEALVSFGPHVPGASDLRWDIVGYRGETNGWSTTQEEVTYFCEKLIVVAYE